MDEETRKHAVTPARLIRTEAQQWFWVDRIPTSTVAIFAGRGGEGKSTFAFHLASQITRGQLQGSFHREPSPVLVWSGEDRWETVIIPRLIAADANLDLVFKLGIESTIDAETLETTPNLPDDLPLVREAILETKSRLVIIDPISSTMRGDMNKEGDARRTLDGLARIAHETGAVFLCIRHFNKGQGNASDKVSGSHAFRDAARAVFLFATDEDSGNKVVSQDKGNYSERGAASIAYQLESFDITTDDGNTASVARVVILGDSDVSVSDIINRTAPNDDDRDTRNAAQAFILDHLRGNANEEANAADVLKAGRAAGFSENEVKHARSRCRTPRITSSKSKFGGGWVWAIDHGSLTQREASEFEAIAAQIEGANQDAEDANPTDNGTLGTLAAPSDETTYCSGCGYPKDRCHNQPRCGGA